MERIEMAENYLFKVEFKNKSDVFKMFSYQLNPNDPNRGEGLVQCWKQAIQNYCSCDPEAEKEFQKFFEKNFWGFHDLVKLEIRYKDEVGKKNKLSCVGTNYTEIGFEMEEA